MDMAVGGSVLKLIFNLAAGISRAAATAKRNKADCAAIASRASTIQAALSSLDDTAAAAAEQHPVVTSALRGLHLALGRALRAVMECQEEHGALSRHLNAGKLSRELRKANENITDQMVAVVLVAGLHTKDLMLKAAEQSRHNHRHTKHRPRPRFIQGDSSLNSRKEKEPAGTSSGTMYTGSNSFDSYKSEAAKSNFSEENLIGQSDSCAYQVHEYTQNRSMPNQFDDIQASPSVPGRTTDEIRDEATQSNVEARVVLLVILFLVLLGTRCALGD